MSSSIGMIRIPLYYIYIFINPNMIPNIGMNIKLMATKPPTRYNPRSFYSSHTVQRFSAKMLIPQVPTCGTSQSSSVFPRFPRPAGCLSMRRVETWTYCCDGTESVWRFIKMGLAPFWCVYHGTCSKNR